MFAPLLPFLVLLVVALIFSYIPMEPTLKKVGYVVIGIAAIYLLLRFLQLA